MAFCIPSSITGGLAADLQTAVDRNAMIFLFGDVFDAMQGRFDPRRSLDELRPEYRRSDYFDFVVKDAARILSPFTLFVHRVLDYPADDL